MKDINKCSDCGMTEKYIRISGYFLRKGYEILLCNPCFQIRRLEKIFNQFKKEIKDIIKDGK